MFIDVATETPNPDQDFDVCIIGAGAAGIAMAMEFMESRDLRVCVLEGGGFEYDDDSQGLYEGLIEGRDYEDLNVARLRYFGGTTNHWAGYCFPIARHSMEQRDWIPESGWPITRDDLEPYYQRALGLLNIGDYPGWQQGGSWDPVSAAPALDDRRLTAFDDDFGHDTLFVHPMRMGEVFRTPLEDAEHIEVFLNANVVEIETDPEGTLATGARVRTFSGQEFLVRAKTVVVAAGGIENARLLLTSDSVQEQGLGNQNGLVGRYFADHSTYKPGRILPLEPATDVRAYQIQDRGPNTQSCVYFNTTTEAQADAAIGAAGIRVYGKYESSGSTGRRSLRNLRRSAAQGRFDEQFGQDLMNVAGDIEILSTEVARFLWYGAQLLEELTLEISLEPAPVYESRVYLGEDRDALGMRRAVLDWRISENDYRTVRWTTERFADLAAANGFGRAELKLGDEELEDSLHWGWHHMCTTRMSTTPASGVVDPDCRVHGMKNLYIAGSSVFTTGGWCSPTLLIIALAQRLSDKLKADLA